MAAAIELRGDFGSAELRALARKLNLLPPLDLLQIAETVN